RLDPVSRTVSRDGEPSVSSKQEFRSSQSFSRRAGQVLSQGDIIEHLYDLDSQRESNAVEVSVSRSRRKIGRDRITTSRGSGYSSRARVLSAILVWVGLGIGGIWFSATRVFTKHIGEQYHEESDVHVRESAGLVKIGPGEHIELTRPSSEPRYSVPLSGFYWQVSVDRGMISRSASMTRGASDEDVAHGPVIVHRLDNGPTDPAITYGSIRKSPSGRDIHFVIATDQRSLDETIARFT
ncbi:hypothetical protein OY671_008672, partial [Metschnikowia pulcherrima]